MPMTKLTENNLHDIAVMLKALADVTRLKIMQALHKNELCVSDIVNEVGTGQANISKHLQILTRAHLLKSRREGNVVYYKIAGPFIDTLCANICKGYETIITKKYGVK